jgi:hypothetical protein
MVARKHLFAMALCSVTALALSGTADAQKVRKTVNPNAQIVAQLRTINGNLHKADHDYQGHRVKAMKQIHAAVKALGGAGKQGKGKFTPGTGKVPQNVSDGILQQAVKDLTVVQTALANSAGPGNRAAAVTAVQTAIMELQTALKIR